MNDLLQTFLVLVGAVVGTVVLSVLLLFLQSLVRELHRRLRRPSGRHTGVHRYVRHRVLHLRDGVIREVCDVCDRPEWSDRHQPPVCRWLVSLGLRRA